MDHRLGTEAMARFVADGYLRFDGIVPAEINEAVIAELGQVEGWKIGQFLGESLPPEAGAASDGGLSLPSTGDRLSTIYPEPSVLGRYLRLPEILGIVNSLVGDDPVYDHDFVHHLGPGSTHVQELHCDAIVDSADPGFDIQLFYFPTEVEAGAGGTRFVPGSHLRRVRAEGIGRYQHVVGEERYTGPAGTVLVFHHGLWHCGQANPSSTDRWMHKVRLNPAGSQVRRWNTADLEEMHNDSSDHTFAIMRTDSVAQVLRGSQPWQRGHAFRYEIAERARLWRYLSDDDSFDVDYYLTRIERRGAHR